MKKIVAIFGMLILVCSLLATSPFAKEAGEDKVSTLLILKNDLVMPQNGKKYYSQAVAPYWHYKWFGFGGEVIYAPRKDYLEVKAFVSANHGPYYVVAGYAGNNLQQKYFQTGAFYLKRFGNTTVLLDVRNFWTANKKAASFLEVWTNVYHPLNDRFYVGFENRYNHWWHGQKRHDLFMLGPLAGVNLTKTVSIYVRPSFVWDFNDGKTRQDFFLRVVLKWKF